MYPIWSYIESVDCIQGVTQNKQVAVVVHKVKVSQTLYTGKNERIDMDRERDLTKGDTAILLSAMPMLKYCDTVCLAPRGLSQS